MALYRALMTVDGLEHKVHSSSFKASFTSSVRPHTLVA
jgi:hypothetical protein